MSKIAYLFSKPAILPPLREYGCGITKAIQANPSRHGQVALQAPNSR